MNFQIWDWSHKTNPDPDLVMIAKMLSFFWYVRIAFSCENCNLAVKIIFYAVLQPQSCTKFNTQYASSSSNFCSGDRKTYKNDHLGKFSFVNSNGQIHFDFLLVYWFRTWNLEELIEMVISKWICFGLHYFIVVWILNHANYCRFRIRSLLWIRNNKKKSDKLEDLKDNVNKNNVFTKRVSHMIVNRILLLRLNGLG